MADNLENSNDYVTEQEFAKAIRKALEKHKVEDLAEEFAATTGVINRWAKEKSSPMRYARSVILQRLENL